MPQAMPVKPPVETLTCGGNFTFINDINASVPATCYLLLLPHFFSSRQAVAHRFCNRLIRIHLRHNAACLNHQAPG
jgi:hypothetical protein